MAEFKSAVSSQQLAVIRQYEKGLVKRSQNEIQLEIDQNKEWKGFSRQMGTDYERKTWAQWLIGRNEDTKIETLQAKGMEVSTSLSTGRNLLNLANMVDARDNVINELVMAGKVLAITKNAEREVFQEKERSFEVQKQLYEEVKKEKEANIVNKDKIIDLMEEKERVYISRIVNIIRNVDQGINIPNMTTIKLGDAITVLENLLHQRLNQ